MKVFSIGNHVVCLADINSSLTGGYGMCIGNTNKYDCTKVCWDNGKTDIVDNDYLDIIPELNTDKINPSHYKQGDIECIDAIKSATMELNGFDGMCTGNAIKYLWRWKQKNGVEDLKKAKWYIDKLIGEQKEVEK